MGYGTFTSKDWSSYKTAKNITNTSKVNDIYTATKTDDKLNPYNVSMRESCDSIEHPESTSIIVGLDVTGSMGSLAECIAKEGLNTLITEIYTKKTITDPQLMLMAIGDAYYDKSPLQVSQFESDIKIAEQLTKIYFEGNGGGNGGESYLSAWYFAARHTRLDSFEKRNKKGYLFTIGDEPNHELLTKNQVSEIFGDHIERDLTATELLNEVSKTYEVYHLVVGNHQSYNSIPKWQQLLGERVLEIKDIQKLPEVIESTIELMEGRSIQDILKNWDGSTALVVEHALKDLKTVKTTGKLIEF